LRFDFSHFEPMTDAEVAAVEQQVNAWVLANSEVNTQLMALEDARKSGAMALFGEKYDDPVRVLAIGDCSIELCGGTHVRRSGDVGLFKIVSEASIKAGVRRIEALTGTAALEHIQNLSQQLSAAAEVIKSDPNHLVERLAALKKHENELTREVEQLKQRLATAGDAGDPVAEAKEFEGTKVLAIQATGIQLSGLRDFADNLRDRLDGGVVMAFAEDKGKLSAVCTVPKALTAKVKAGDLLRAVFAVTGGKGGGRPDFAQGGGGDEPVGVAG